MPSLTLSNMSTVDMFDDGRGGGDMSTSQVNLANLELLSYLDPIKRERENFF